jgi:hypothetical protein
VTVSGASIAAPYVPTPDPVATLRAILIARFEAASLEQPPIVGNVREGGDTPPFYVLSEAGEERARGAGVLLPARVGLSAWSLTEAGAVAGYRMASDLLHRTGPVTVDTTGVWKVFDETGVQRPLRDPDSGWWLAAGVFDLYMTDRAIGG